MWSMPVVEELPQVERKGDIVSMVTCIGSKQPQDPPGSFNQVRILLYPLDRPAHRGAIHWPYR
jgi:hypothetical protein